MSTKKKTMKKTLCLAMATFALVSSGCNNGGEQTEEPIEASVWSEHGATFVLRDEEVDESRKTAAKYEISSARGEYESSQIMITAGTEDIEEYTLEVCDLVSTTDPEKKIAAENVYVYNEHYIEVKSSTSREANGILGWYPDGMIPLDLAVEYGENTVAAGDNQGLYISTYIPRATEAGEYTGTFKLKMDGKETLIPASVTVWDFEVPQQRSFRTQVGWGFSQQSTLFVNMDTTLEFETIAREWLVDYGLCSSSSQTTGDDYEDWCEWVRISTNPNLVDENGQPYHSEEVPYLGSISFHTKYNAQTGIDYDYFDARISRLVVASIRDNFNYVERMHVYPSYIDEPQFNNTWTKVNETFEGWQTRKAYWVDLLERATSSNSNTAKLAIQEINAASGKDLTEEEVSENSSFVSELKVSAGEIPMYLTCYPDDRLDPEVVNQFTSHYDAISTEEKRRNIEEWVQTDRIDDIWYSVDVAYGVGAIDSTRMNNRLISWYSRHTDRSGYLIWAADLMTNRSKGDAILETEPYQDPVHISTSNGDGWFVYPGAKYGIDGFIGSHRLMQLRASVEEYEYFTLLGKLYEAAGYSEDKILERIFNNVFNEAVMTEDAQVFEEQRELVAKLILLAQKGVFVTDYEELNGLVSMSVKTTGEEKIASVNGEACDLAEATITADSKKSVGGATFTTTSGIAFGVDLGGKATSLLTFDTSKIKVINGASKTGTGDSAKYTDLEGAAEKTVVPDTNVEALKFTYNVDRAEISQDYAKYNFVLSADSSSLNRNCKYLAITFYNPSDEDVLVQCYLKGSGGATFLRDKILKKGWNVMYVSQLDYMRWNVVKKLEGLRFDFKSYNAEDVHDFTVYCTDVSVIK